MSNAPKCTDAACRLQSSSAFVQQTFEFEADPESRPTPNDNAADTVRDAAAHTDPLVDATERYAFWSIANDVANRCR